ncbi:MAG: hypothetical protein U9Q27_00365 [Patescibacteria group bacterium]|nr:hypothetical protein [Patescibacteria group bacterium]
MEIGTIIELWIALGIALNIFIGRGLPVIARIIIVIGAPIILILLLIFCLCILFFVYTNKLFRTN